MNKKHWKNIYHANVNTKLMVEKVIQIKIVMTINIEVSTKKLRKHHAWEEDCILNHSTCACKNYKYLWSIIAISVDIYDEIIEVTKTVVTKTVSIKILQ